MFWGKSKLIANVLEDNCCNCSCCVHICRQNALKTAVVQEKTVTFVDRPERCTGCGKCVVICPNQAIELIKRYC
jgi:MinD superfamily P-loop ATPase